MKMRTYRVERSTHTLNSHVVTTLATKENPGSSLQSPMGIPLVEKESTD